MTAGPDLLRRNYRPVEAEHDWTDVPVAGSLPGSLSGTYVRNGPNRAAGETGGLWFTGPGTVHAVRFEAGRARYASRRVGTGDAPASAGLVHHAGALLALSDFGPPVRVDAVTLTPRRAPATEILPAGCGSVLPHTVASPVDGTLVTLAAGWDDDRVRILERGRDGRWRERGRFAVPARPFLHDVALAGDRLVVLDLPWRRRAHGPVWEPESGARLGLVDLDGRDPRWFDVEPGYVSHVASARAGAGGVVEVFACRRPTPGVHPAETNPFDRGRGSLRRYTVEPRSGCVREDDVDARPCDFPVRSHDGDSVFVTRPAGGNYTVAAAVDRVDLRTGATARHALGPARFGGEVQAVTTGTGDEVLVGFVHDTAADRSELVVLDGSRPDRPPLATVALPGRVPWGLHGTWIAADG